MYGLSSGTNTTDPDLEDHLNSYWQLTDMPTRGLPTRDFVCLVFVFWPFIDVFLHVYLNVYYANDSVSSIIMLTQPNHAIKTTDTTAGGIRKTASCPVCVMSSRAGSVWFFQIWFDLVFNLKYSVSVFFRFRYSHITATQQYLSVGKHLRRS